MAEKEQHGFDPTIVKRLQFVKWYDLQTGRPDRHGVRTPLPTFEAASEESQQGSRREKSFIPDNTTGV